MSWARELHQAFERLARGEPPAAAFADRQDTLGEIGRELNALGAEWRRRAPGEMAREDAHRLRNRLAGILAALRVVEATEDLAADDRTALARAVDQAKEFDARLRAG